MLRLLALFIVCLSLAGCTPTQPTTPKPLKFQCGEMVTLKIAGCGQILTTYTRCDGNHYMVRVSTHNGPSIIHMYEFELEATQ